MLVAILLVLTIGYQLVLLRRGRMFAWGRIAFGARHLRWAATLWLGYGVTALIGLLVVQRLAGIGHDGHPTGLCAICPPGAAESGQIAALKRLLSLLT